MALNLGGTAITALRLGDAAVDKLMLGDVQVWPAAVVVPPPSGELWTPVDLPGTVGWFDASETGTVIEAGGKVSQWNNRITQYGNMTQTDGAKQPVLTMTGPGGREAVEFSDGFMFANAPVNGVSNTTMFAVMKMNIIGNTEDMLVAMGQAPAGSRIRALYRGVDSDFLGYATWANDIERSELRLDTTDFNVIGARQEGAAVTLAKNGVITAFTLPAQPLDIIDDHVSIGSAFGSASGNYHTAARYCEVLFVNNAVAADDRERTQGYLAHKWGLQALLPDDHPYKNAPPTKPAP